MSTNISQTSPLPHLRTGAQLLIDCLIAEDVDTIFGYPGGAVIPIYDALYDCKEIKHMLTRHEQAAVHAADGYARVKGKPGVALVTSGPGATNAVTGIANAFMDSVPLVVLTGQVPTDLIGRDSFQEVNIFGMTMDITKHNYVVMDIADLPRIIKEAFHIASTGRPGPVLIDLPKNVMNARSDSHPLENINIRGYKRTEIISDEEIETIKGKLLTAKRPVILAGGGVVSAGASDELIHLANRLQIPVVSTLMGIGSFPTSHPLYLGMLGMHGTYAANRAVHYADVLLSLGARFNDRLSGKAKSFSPNSWKIHVDIDNAELNKNIEVDLAIQGDIKDLLCRLVVRLSQTAVSDSSSAPGATSDSGSTSALGATTGSGSTSPTDATSGTTSDSISDLNSDSTSAARPAASGWAVETAKWQRKVPHITSQPGILCPQEVIQLLHKHTEGKAIVATDVGQHQIWTAHHYQFDAPRSFLTSGGLGTMGFGLPAAIGAAIADPKRTVVCVTGDGSFQMNLQEVMTAVDFNLPIKIAIMNNGFLGMVRQWQQLFYQRRYSSVHITSPNYVEFANSYGVPGLRATTLEEADCIIHQAMYIPGPVLLEFIVKEEQNVYPMVPPGGSNDKMITSDAE